MAAQIAVEHVVATFDRHPAVSKEAVQRYIGAAQEAILAQQRKDPYLARMRSTLVVLVADAQAALWAHIGDSRLYYFRDGGIVHQTKDHSVPQVLVAAGDLRPDEIRRHEDRNRLLRSLGHPDELQPSIEPQPHALRQGDAFLLCTDGFWDYVLEEDMQDDLAQAAHPQQWLDAMQARLVNRTDNKQDDYSAIAVMVQEHV